MSELDKALDWSLAILVVMALCAVVGIVAFIAAVL